MLSVIKTAIITIIISFISGVLLDSYKNFAPKIMCILGKGFNKKIGSKTYREYSITVKNVSRKTLHDLNVNIQDELESILIKDARITKGLRFHMNEEYNDYNIAIPFLSKNDEFTARIVVEETEENENKPYIALRSPEKFKKSFKEVKEKQESVYDLRSSINLNEKDDDLDKTVMIDSDEMKKAENSELRRHKNKRSFINRKILISSIGVLIIVYIAVLGIEQINKSSNNTDVNTGTSSISRSNNGNNDDSAADLDSANNSEAKSEKNTEEKTVTESKNNTSSTKNESASKNINNSSEKPADTSKAVESTEASKGATSDNSKKSAETQKESTVSSGDKDSKNSSSDNKSNVEQKSNTNNNDKSVYTDTNSEKSAGDK